MRRKNNKNTLEKIQPKKTKSQTPPKKEINPNAEYRDQLVKIYVSKTELKYLYYSNPIQQLLVG